MQDGKIIQQGTLHDLVHDPVDDFVIRFINAHRGPLDVLKG
jgi:ABC-type proline/glycine betaine transport system ATPase subunit